jgi:hypothetical protein
MKSKKQYRNKTNKPLRKKEPVLDAIMPPSVEDVEDELSRMSAWEYELNQQEFHTYGDY